MADVPPAALPAAAAAAQPLLAGAQVPGFGQPMAAPGIAELIAAGHATNGRVDALANSLAGLVNLLGPVVANMANIIPFNPNQVPPAPAPELLVAQPPPGAAAGQPIAAVVPAEVPQALLAAPSMDTSSPPSEPEDDGDENVVRGVWLFNKNGSGNKWAPRLLDRGQFEPGNRRNLFARLDRSHDADSPSAIRNREGKPGLSVPGVEEMNMLKDCLFYGLPIVRVLQSLQRVLRSGPAPDVGEVDEIVSACATSLAAILEALDLSAASLSMTNMAQTVEEKERAKAVRAEVQKRLSDSTVLGGATFAAIVSDVEKRQTAAATAFSAKMAGTAIAKADESDDWRMVSSAKKKPAANAPAAAAVGSARAPAVKAAARR
jgi:hypothetical protein